MSVETTRQRLIGANPVPEPDQLNAEAREAQALLAVIKQRSGIGMAPTYEATTAETARPTKHVQRLRRGLLGAAAAFALTLLVAFGIIALSQGGHNDVADSTPQDSDAATVEQLFADLNAGDLKGALGDLDVDDLRQERLRRVFDFTIGLGAVWQVSECTATPEGSAALVVCQVGPRHTVFDALGETTLLYAFKVRDGLIEDYYTDGILDQLVPTATLYRFAWDRDPVGTEEACGTEVVEMAADSGKYFTAGCGAFLAGHADDLVTSLKDTD